MKILTKDTSYAVRALACMAGSPESVVPVKELAANLDIPGPFLRKILQVLNKKGILNSYKGKGGGFSLAVAPEKVSLLDLIDIFQGGFYMNDHVIRKEICPNINTCALKGRLDEVEEKVCGELKDITIASLINK